MHKKYCTDISWYENLENSYPKCLMFQMLLCALGHYSKFNRTMYSIFKKNHFQINEFVKSFFLNLPCERNGDQHFIFINLIKSSTLFVLLLKKVLDIVISVCTSYKLSGNS